MNPVMEALKNAVAKGTKFTLTQKGSENNATLIVSGGVSTTALDLPFKWVGEPGAKDFEFHSSERTAGLLASAVEGMPDEAEPSFLLDMKEWKEGGLILTGEWEVRKGRAKEGKKHSRSFLIDAGVIDAD